MALKTIFACIFALFATVNVQAQAPVSDSTLMVADSLQAEPQSESESTAQPVAENLTGPEQKIADIKKLLVSTRAIEIGLQALGDMIENFRQNLPAVPDTFWLEFADRIKTEDLMDMMIPIYDKYLSHEDILTLLEFYQSPIGQKLISVQPEIIRESTLASRAWGEKIARDVAAELQKQGYLQALQR